VFESAAAAAALPAIGPFWGRAQAR
jgi:hypothetical protein